MEGNFRKDYICFIDLLPDHCLWKIFEQFSLEQIISLRNICRRWCGLIDCTLKKQTNLKLFASKTDLVRFKQRQIEFDLNRNTPFSILKNEILILHPKITKWSKILIRIFPNVEVLLIECPGKQYLQFDLINAIHYWHKTIKHLTLIGWSDICSDEFWKILNSIENLQAMLFFGLYRNRISNNMTLFRQLQSFSLVHYLDDVVPVFTQLGPNLKFILISWIYLNVSQLEKIVAYNPSITKSLEFLRLGYISSFTDHGADRERNFRRILLYFAKNFKNIRQLSILFADNLPLIEMGEIFCNMTNLSRLSFYLSREQLPRYGKVNLSRLPALNSVTSLYVEIFSIQADVFHFWIDLLFPNLKDLTVKTNIDKFDDKFRLLEMQFLARFTKLDSFSLKN